MEAALAGGNSGPVTQYSSLILRFLQSGRYKSKKHRAFTCGLSTISFADPGPSTEC